ncbi:shikimate O-hydroxycinnamoyltransferase-like [Magnolia sinica]|uniref:shikimate O-hydroxycinnamoyltransferase-like n=1 Tax=Magnolia sinica TaxID=86752 RepID=UPI00265A4986|nr:shikimate O-hydroxycinnamoyltransferase-like [Magnolia sinica]
MWEKETSIDEEFDEEESDKIEETVPAADDGKGSPPSDSAEVNDYFLDTSSTESPKSSPAVEFVKREPNDESSDEGGGGGGGYYYGQGALYIELTNILHTQNFIWFHELGKQAVQDGYSMTMIQPTTHALTVYFYHPKDAAIDFFSPEFIKDSLSRALVQYYPLAGRLHPGPSDRLELECNAMGVLFVEAESDAQIDDFGDFKPGPGLRELVPNIDYNTHIGEWPLLLVQLTFFRCGGVYMGIGIAHTIVDGFAALQFISAWARIARGDAHVGIDPFFDRTIM